MGVLKKTVNWVLLGFAGLVAIGLVLYAASRFSGPTQAQRAAMALLAQTTPAEGRNAFGALWLLPYDVPADQIDAITAEDAARFATRPSAMTSDPPYWNASNESVAAQRFGPSAPLQREPALCGFEPGCLAKLTKTREQAAIWRHDNSKLIARLVALSDYGHVRNQFASRFDMPMPSFVPLTLLPSLRALDHVEGRHDLALTGVCRDITMWRRLSKDTDSLVFSLIAARGISAELMVMADMLAELPAEHPLPDACEAAFKAPVDVEFSLCSVMRGEVAWALTGLAEVESGRKGPEGAMWMSLFFDEAATRARMAPVYAWPCSPEALAAVIRDEPIRVPPPSPSNAQSFECWANMAGCILATTGPPEFGGYAHRRQDVGAWLRLMRTLLALRAQRDTGPALAQGLAKLPDNAPGTHRATRVTDDGNALSIPLFDTGKGTEARLTLRSTAKPR